MRTLARPLAEVHRGSGEMHGRRLSRVVGVALMLIGIAPGLAAGATTLPVLWTAGGLDAGTTGAGQAARMASDSLKPAIGTPSRRQYSCPYDSRVTVGRGGRTSASSRKLFLLQPNLLGHRILIGKITVRIERYQLRACSRLCDKPTTSTGPRRGTCP